MNDKRTQDEVDRLSDELVKNHRALEEIQQDTIDKLDQTIEKFRQIQELADSMKPTHPTVDPLVHLQTYNVFVELLGFGGNRG